MAAIVRYLAPDNTSDTAFQAWGKQMSADLTSIGIVKTSDIGQIDWASVTAPSSGNAYCGYEMRQFTDNLQNINPVFIKIRYGSANRQEAPRIELTIGSSTDGNGNLLTQVTASVSVTNDIGENGIAYTTKDLQLCLFSGTPNRLVIGLFAVYGKLPQYYCIERTKDSIGNDTADGVLFTAVCTGVRQNQFIPAPSTGLPVPLAVDTGFFTPDRGTSAGDGTNFSIYPNYFFRGGTQLNPAINTLCYFGGDVPTAQIIPVSMYGVTYNYVFTGFQPTSGSYSYVARGGIPNTALAILFE